MSVPVVIARLIRKRPLDTSASDPTPVRDETIGSAVTKTTSAPLTVGYFIAFAYAAILAPSTLPAVIFIACIASLLSELCKYEFLSCKRGTSTCPYICTYQLLGELPAYVQGWLQLLNRAVQVALIARGLGSVLVLILGERLVRHHLISDYLVHEDTFGIGAQVFVSLFIIGGLQLTGCLMTTVKVLIVSAVLLFVSTTAYYAGSKSEAVHHNKESAEEPFLMAAAFIFIAFKPENHEPKLHSNAKNVSVYLSINHSAHLLLLVAMAVVVCLVPASSLSSHEDSSPLLEMLMGLISGSHWFVITFACLCILIGALTLVEAVRDSSRHAVKMASDGLLLKHIAQNNATASLATLLLSLAAEVLFSTIQLICLSSFVYLALDSMTGIVVTYRRYCTSHSVPIPARWKNLRRRFNEYERPVDADRPDDSDDTDIDAAVDDYKTEVYVSTSMSWNGSEMMEGRSSSRAEQIRKASPKMKLLLFSLFVLMVVMSVLLRDIVRMHLASMAVGCLCFVTFLLILFVIWLHPQKVRAAADVVFKVPCVPWIPAISSLSHIALLFQLPLSTWATASSWTVAGLIFYGFYGYRRSRLNMRKRMTKPIRNGTMRGTAKVRQFQIPGALLSVAANSIAVYPQAYHNMA